MDGPPLAPPRRRRKRNKNEELDEMHQLQMKNGRCGINDDVFSSKKHWTIKGTLWLLYRRRVQLEEINFETNT